MGTAVAAIEPHAVVLTDGAQIPAGLTIWAGGNAMGSLVTSLDLQRDRRGRLLVDELVKGGHEVAVQCAKALLLPMPRILQSGYSMVPVSKSHDDERIRKVEAWLQGNFREEVPLRLLAGQAGRGERTFARHFKAATGRMPAAYVQALRIEAAKALLEQGDKPIQTVSAEIGYDDATVSRVSISAALGPGSVSSTGLSERRVLRSSRASGIVFPIGKPPLAHA